MLEKPADLRNPRTEDIMLDYWLRAYERTTGISFPALRASLRRWRATFRDLDKDGDRNDS